MEQTSRSLLNKSDFWRAEKVGSNISDFDITFKVKI